MESIEEDGKAVGAEESAKVKSSGKSPSTDAEKPHGKKHYEIDIFRGWCKSCGICVAFCPRECLSLDSDGSPVISDSGRCTGCGWCETHCPDFAISVREKNCVKAQTEES
jgi:2-oxoglutarate ferredoxin oxidoreductase subunit delta